MTEGIGEKIKKAAPGVFFALVTLGTAACEKIGLRDGDPGTVVKQTNCWQYPGGENATRLEAPQGQVNNGLIPQGAIATVTVDEETEVFGATSNLGTYLRVEISGENINPLQENQVCWIKSTDFSPINK